MFYHVKEVSTLSGVSVRTLHHYDQIGLLKPASVSPAGYRQYTRSDLETLQQILYYKELDFNLTEIQQLMSGHGHQKKKLLKAQYQLLQKKKKRLDKIIRLLDQTIQPVKGAKQMKDEALFKAFDISDLEQHKKAYVKETEQLYGDSNAFQECTAKTKNYSKERWVDILNQANAIYKELASLMNKSPDDPVVQDHIQKWQDHITHHYYQCTNDILKGLGQLYIDDPRYTKNIDKIKPGLAAFISKAITIYCR